MYCFSFLPRLPFWYRKFEVEQDIIISLSTTTAYLKKNIEFLSFKILRLNMHYANVRLCLKTCKVVISEFLIRKCAWISLMKITIGRSCAVVISSSCSRIGFLLKCQDKNRHDLFFKGFWAIALWDFKILSYHVSTIRWYAYWNWVGYYDKNFEADWLQQTLQTVHNKNWLKLPWNL